MKFKAYELCQGSLKNVERISVNCFEPTEHLQHLKSFNNNKDPPSDIFIHWKSIFRNKSYTI